MWLTFFLWVASFLISDYFRAKLPAVDPSGEGDFQSPTATEGRKVPQVVGGTVKVKGPNTLGYWDWDAEDVTVETGMIFKRDETVGYSYKVGLALGQFVGECEGMTAVYIGDDKVWDYVDDNGGVVSSVADIDLPELFGGETSGGGFQGRVRCFTGNNSQSVSAYLLSKNPLQSAWPGFTYVVITDLTETEGATIGESNNLRDIRVEFQTFSTLANGGLGNALGLTGDTHIIGRDANPLAAAYNVLNNADWSINTGDVNLTSFADAAQICFDEGIGYSQQVDSEMEAYEIIAEIEKHIDGYIGPNPTNGLLEVNLARNDYVIADEFQANETNIKEINNYAKAEWPQTKNEVKIRFVNREKDYKDDHAVAQDMAGRLIAGRPISTTIRFPGLRDATAANGIVARTSRAYFWPLAKFELLMDRTAYAIRPGDVVVVTHPEIAAVDLPCRVTRTRTGDPVKQTIRLDVVEDVFQFETGTQADPQPSEHVPPSDQPMAISNFESVRPPRWLYEREDQVFEPRLMFLVARDSPNNGYNIRYRTRATAFSGNLTAKFEDQQINVHVKHGTLRALPGSPQESPALALDMLRDTTNEGLASEAEGGAFYVDGSLASIIGTYNPIDYIPGQSGLAVIDPNGPNEEWIAISTITASSGGIYCEGVVRCIGDSAVKKHYEGEDFWFIDTGAYFQENVRPSETDNAFGYLFEIRPQAPSGLGSYSAEQAEQNVHIGRLQEPYPPTAIIIDQLSTTVWFAQGDLDASVPTNLTTPSVAGLNMEVWNRRFDQNNPILGANSRNDLAEDYSAGSFDDVNPTLNWWLYNLDTTPNPTHDTDSIISGSDLGLDAGKNQKFFDQSVFQGIAGLSSPFNCRFEFSWENAASPGVDGVLAGTESNYSWTEHLVTFYPDHESHALVEDTLLLLHFDGLDMTTQVLDYSPNNHTVVLSGGVQIDTDIESVAFASPNLNSGHLWHPTAGNSPAQFSPELFCEVIDNSPHVFTQMTSQPGFTIQARVYFTATPSGEVPIVTKWREGDNERQFWFGLNDTTLRLKMSTDGTDELIETTGTRTWNLNQWYEICVCVWDAPATGTTTYVYFFVDGVFDERETFADDQIFHDSAAPVRIGSDGDGNTVPASTYIDEVRILKLPVYKTPYTQQVAQFPGRETQKVLHAHWEQGSDGDTSYNTDDLNRYPVDFPSAEVTELDLKSPFISSPTGKSLLCSGVNASGFDNSDGVRIPDTGSTGIHAENFEFGLNDFTMECWVNFNVMPASHSGAGVSLITKYLRGNFPFWNWGFYFNKSGFPVFFYRNEAAVDTTLSGSDVVTGVSPNLTTDTWHHAAVCRKDGILSLFWDGVRVGFDDTNFVSLSIDNHHHSNVCLGRLEGNNSTDHWTLNGWLDDCRILNGEAAYDGATYTVPTAPLPTDPAPEPTPPIPSPQSPFTPPSPMSPFTPAEEGAPSNWQPSNL